MAAVAFPFSCITSDDLEQGNPYLLFGDGKEAEVQSQSNDSTAMSDVDCASTVCSETASVPSLAPSRTDPATTEPGLEDEENDIDDDSNNDEHMIDNAFFEELNGNDNDEDNDDRNNSSDNMDDGDVTMTSPQVEDNNEDPSPTTESETNNEATPQTSFGGLSNLGNTCYLNSAMQMVASLDSFAQHLRLNPLPEQPISNNGIDEESSQEKWQLRNAFLDVVALLSKGETVSPTEFKRLLDERTPLFVGYRQQDSHEFLTTLFDLLDEDYKVKPVKKEEEKESNITMDATAAAVEKEGEDSDASNNSEGEMPTIPEITDECENRQEEQENQVGEATNTEEQATAESKDANDEEESELYESATKKPRNLEEVTVPSMPPHRVQSFSDLMSDGIEKLLFADVMVGVPSQTATASPSPPRCKLVGGRMAAPDIDHHQEVLITESDVATPAMCMDCDNSEAEEEESSRIISPVESYLKTEVRVRLTCDSCKYTRSHTESFFHLSLEIGSDNSSVADGLRKFFAPETRELKCEKCFCATAQQTTEITRLPKALLLHFKRFIVDISDDYTSITYRKNQSDILFEDQLELSEEKGGVLGEFLANDVSMPEEAECGDYEEDRIYQIRSVVNHIGSSASCGHYTADATRALPSGAERQWNRFNDSDVSSISPDEAMKDSSRTAYMVMYEMS